MIDDVGGDDAAAAPEDSEPGGQSETSDSPAPRAPRGRGTQRVVRSSSPSNDDDSSEDDKRRRTRKGKQRAGAFLPPSPSSPPPVERRPRSTTRGVTGRKGKERALTRSRAPRGRSLGGRDRHQSPPRKLEAGTIRRPLLKTPEPQPPARGRPPLVSLPLMCHVPAGKLTLYPRYSST